MERQIADEISKYTILPEFRDWALEVLKDSHEKETEDRNRIYESQHKAVEEAQRKLDNLVRMRCSEMIVKPF